MATEGKRLLDFVMGIDDPRIVALTDHVVDLLDLRPLQET